MNNFKNNSGRFLLAVVFAIAGPALLFAQVSYTFTSCGANGQFGPNAGQVTAFYSSTNLSGSVTVLGGGIQQFVIPTSGLWGLEAWGAQGGNSTIAGGLGARMKGEFNFTAGQVISILVGQQGLGQSGNAAGGGGGSYVALGNVPQLVAGGGSGGNIATPGLPAGINMPGDPGQNCPNAGATGMGGGDASACGSGAGGAGGFFGNGLSGGSWGSQFGYGFVNGGNGGTSATANSHGGFGGGAGTHANNTGGGAGGGYTGGGASQHSSAYVGGAGSSYNIGANQSNSPGVNTGNGKVILTRLCNISLNSSSNPICIGQSVTLSTDAASNITWSGSPLTGNSIVVSPNITTTYSVAGTSTANCNTSAQITIIVNPLPVLSAVVTPTTLCVGKTATIVANGASTYTWNGGPTGVALMVTPGVTTSYNLTGTSPYGCLNSVVIPVNVNTNSLTVTPAVSLCKGSALTLTALGAGSYTWSNGSNFANVPVSPSASTTYTVEGIDAFGCKLSSMVPVTVNSTPTITANASKPNPCRNEPVTLTASGSASTYTWSNNATGPVASIVTPVDVMYSYTVTGEDNNGCTATAIVTVSVNKCVGINEFNKAGLEAKVYPNPVGNTLTVELNNGSNKVIEITDMSGRLILSRSGNGEAMDLDVTRLANGVYYVKLRSDDMTEVFKIVKGN
jgi:hypothetical protein